MGDAIREAGGWSFFLFLDHELTLYRKGDTQSTILQTKPDRKIWSDLVCSNK